MAQAVPVILIEDSAAGQSGELVKVKPGFARNYLLPKGLAVFADAYNLKAYEERKAELEQIAQEKKEQAAKDKETLGEDASITMVAPAGEEGKLFGSITKVKIAKAVKEQLNIEITKENVDMKSTIKEIGEHPVKLDLGFDIGTTILVKVVPEES